MNDRLIAVASRTFSRHEVLRKELQEKFSNVRFNDEGKKLQGQELVEFLTDCHGAIIALEKMDENVLSQLSKLEVISKYGVGLDNIDQKLLDKYGIKLGWTGGVNRRSVSELALGFVLNLLRRVHEHDAMIRDNQWKILTGNTLSEKTIGIIGFGFVGKDLAELLAPFRCQLFVNDIQDMSAIVKNRDNIKLATKEEIYKSCDVISLHVPYDESTHRLIGEHEFKQMQKHAILVNTSRGNVVDENALYHALKQGQVRAAAMDVFSEEPLIDSPLMTLQNFLATPHVGGSSQESVLAMGRVAIENISQLL